MVVVVVQGKRNEWQNMDKTPQRWDENLHKGGDNLHYGGEELRLRRRDPRKEGGGWSKYPHQTLKLERGESFSL
jgi:hypothetical protein